MTAQFLPLVLALTRAWLRVYTLRMPPPIAQARRAEIESDIWAMEHDVDLVPGFRTGWVAIARLIDGMGDDLAWRFENAAIEEQLIVRRLFALAAAAALVVSLWTVPSFFVNGQDQVEACAATVRALESNADIRFEVMRCAGAFFASAQ